MSQSKQDSDFEVCLTADQYSRILSVQKQTKKQRQQFRQQKLSYQSTIQSLKQEIQIYECTIKHKNNEIDELIIQCLRLKKLRIRNEDEIRNYKEEQLKIKEMNLTELERSIKENKEMKENKLSDETIISNLRMANDILLMDNHNLSEKLNKRMKEEEERNNKLNVVNEQLRKQVGEVKGKGEDSMRKIDQMEEAISKLEKRNSEKMEKVKGMEGVISKLKEEGVGMKEELEKKKVEYEKQIELMREENKVMKNTIKSKEDQGKQLDQKIITLSESLSTLRSEIDLLKHQNDQKINLPQPQPQTQKFSSRIFQLLQFAKSGIIHYSQLKQQIQNILVLQKEYEDIIFTNNLKIKNYEEIFKNLEMKNKELTESNEYFIKQLENNSKIIHECSELRDKKGESSLLSQNITVKEECERLKGKLQRVKKDLDETVESYNYQLSDQQRKYQKELVGYSECKDQIEAMRLHHKELVDSIDSGLDIFGEKLRVKLEGKGGIDTASIMKLLRGNLPNMRE